MELTKAHLICFSPTSTSKQVGQGIVHGMETENITITDVTLSEAGELDIVGSEVAVIAVPVYGGRVAPLALQRMKNIRGNDTPAVLVVVYGNRAYEKALMELDAFAIRQGFKVIGAATFVGEHSYHTEKHPIAQGRPDQDDLLFAHNFGKLVAEKIRTAETLGKVYPVDVRSIRRPKQSLFGLLRFLRGVIKMRKSEVPVPKAPVTDESLCIHCGICVKKCPNAAIIKGEEQHTIVEKCIRCCACVKACPERARSFDTPFAPLLSKNFPKQKQPQTLL
ncbi:4Fe-4S binding protein [Bacteroides sp. 51]|uniref:4Fe-4S binding protein n=1 Tax=Bacteroides sp. 51 TaxID=2302938 RepID=UPI0013D36583|nr:4Fe-4S binding protein [Bacteroides sp. 51]